ncbi:hypothetical protein [Methylobacterium sp. WL7]|uniref:hypothetical protein n=1 Tax=Methylobacterium sp. WL7 TaxID=2603900 RepID=UPI0011CC55EB|nr:hypothetical protein [Methylobacterium sp. WL7]TXN43407.1 hypothetical protein FV233_18580 [Methylobacterium sp. WL7]
MNLLRKRLEIGQDYRSDDGKIHGVIIEICPVENGSEALVWRQTTAEVARVFIPGEEHPQKR